MIAMNSSLPSLLWKHVIHSRRVRKLLKSSIMWFTLSAIINSVEEAGNLLVSHAVLDEFPPTCEQVDILLSIPLFTSRSNNLIFIVWYCTFVQQKNHNSKGLSIQENLIFCPGLVHKCFKNCKKWLNSSNNTFTMNDLPHFSSGSFLIHSSVLKLYCIQTIVEIQNKWARLG